MLYVIYLLLIITGFIVKNAKWYRNMVVIFLCFITVTNTNHADYYAYNNLYNSIGMSGFYLNNTPLWTFLCMLGNLLHLTYNSFCTILLLFSLISISSTVEFYAKDSSSIVYALFLIFPGLIDIVQLRNFIAFAIFIFSIRFLTKNTLFGIFSYLLSIMIATLIHNSIIVYSLFILTPFIRDRHIKTLIIPVCLLVGVLAIFRKYAVNLVQLLFNDNRRINLYMSNSLAIGKLMVCLFFFACSYILIEILVLSLHNRPSINMSFMNIARKCNLLILLTIPLVMYDVDFMRLHRGLWIINFIAFGLYANNIKDIFTRVSYKCVYLIYVTTANIAFINLFDFNAVTKPLLTFDGWKAIFK